MADLRDVVADGESCPICGSEWVVLTTVKQPDKPEVDGWWARVDDEARCDECGAHGRVDVDDGGPDEDCAYVSFDEIDPHNVACAEKWEADRG